MKNLFKKHPAIGAAPVTAIINLQAAFGICFARVVNGDDFPIFVENRRAAAAGFGIGCVIHVLFPNAEHLVGIQGNLLVLTFRMLDYCHCLSYGRDRAGVKFHVTPLAQRCFRIVDNFDPAKVVQVGCAGSKITGIQSVCIPGFGGAVCVDFVVEFNAGIPGNFYRWDNVVVGKQVPLLRQKSGTQFAIRAYNPADSLGSLQCFFEPIDSKQVVLWPNDFFEARFIGHLELVGVQASDLGAGYVWVLLSSVPAGRIAFARKCGKTLQN